VPDRTFTTIAKATTGQILTVDGPNSGLQWVIYQLSVETIPFRAGAIVVVRRNGRIITSSSSGGRASAQGPPAILMSNSDEITVQWDNVTPNDELLVTLFYTEQPFGAVPIGYGVV